MIKEALCLVFKIGRAYLRFLPLEYFGWSSSCVMRNYERDRAVLLYLSGVGFLRTKVLNEWTTNLLINLLLKIRSMQQCLCTRGMEII